MIPIIKLTTEDKISLIGMLKILFPEFKRIEIREQNLIYILFSKVSSTSIYNFIRPDLVSCKVPLLELFIRELPRRLSIYQLGNESSAPIYWATAALLAADNPSYLVSYFKSRVDKIKKSTYLIGEEPYHVTLAKLNSLERSINNGGYNVLNSVLKTVNTDTLMKMSMYEAIESLENK